MLELKFTQYYVASIGILIAAAEKDTPVWEVHLSVRCAEQNQELISEDFRAIELVRRQ